MVNTLKIFCKKIKTLFYALGICLFIVGYFGIMIYFAERFPKHAKDIVFGGILLLIVGQVAFFGLKELITWLMKNWQEAKRESGVIRSVRNMENKAIDCIHIAERMLPNTSDSLIELQAEDLMDMPDSAVIETLQRLEISESAEMIKKEQLKKVSLKTEPKLLSRYDIAKGKAE
jgi:Na+/phosphate symporter